MTSGEQVVFSDFYTCVYACEIYLKKKISNE